MGWQERQGDNVLIALIVAVIVIAACAFFFLVRLGFWSQQLILCY